MKRVYTIPAVTEPCKESSLNISGKIEDMKRFITMRRTFDLRLLFVVHAINYWLREYKIIYVAKGQDWKPVLDYHYLKALSQQGFKKKFKDPHTTKKSETLPSFLRLSSKRLKWKVLLMLPSDGMRSMSAPVKAPLILNDMFRFNKNTCCHLGNKIFSRGLTCFSKTVSNCLLYTLQ